MQVRSQGSALLHRDPVRGGGWPVGIRTEILCEHGWPFLSTGDHLPQLQRVWCVESAYLRASGEFEMATVVNFVVKGSTRFNKWTL